MAVGWIAPSRRDFRLGYRDGDIAIHHGAMAQAISSERSMALAEWVRAPTEI